MSKSRHELALSEEIYRAGTEFERTSKVYTRRSVPEAPPQLRILDVGCGTGVNASHLAAAGHVVTGVDLSPSAISQFRQAGFVGVVADIAEGLPFEDAHFDLVFASEVIEHLADTNFFLSEIHRVLKDGGRLIVSTPNSAFWAYRVLSLTGKTLSDIQHPGHIRFFSKRSLTTQLTAAGFRVDTVAARHVYFIASGRLADRLSGVLAAVGFRREMRFRTRQPFWHLSAYRRSASAFWAETLIASCIKRSSGAP